MKAKGTVKAERLPGMIKDDLGTCGLDSCMLVVKSDQEPAIKET